ncbi:MAG: bifunctional hydroxymethylpyrimidine kinase/phosphomethylpyrimidine kinase [Caldithrix sp.]|nr:bifunctional hydroxymethylpyrimidine kinase/phosphomethylpyrimidine kinase [Caldithrix sp.]
MTNKKRYPVALTIAGSDSGGGAGIQADLKTFSANGVYGMSVITALTAQNTQGVRGIYGVPPAFIDQQLQTVLDDISTHAVKIGMLHSSAVINTVVENLIKYQPQHIVLDPVMVAASGDKLLEDEAIADLKTNLLPLATVITPNIPEAEVILQDKIQSIADMKQAVQNIADLTGGVSVLLKGGHGRDDQLIDVLYNAPENTIREYKFERVQTKNTHGTGCTLSSAIAAALAKGFALQEAVAHGVNYVHEAIIQGAEYKLGAGYGPVHHFFKFWQ